MTSFFKTTVAASAMALVASSAFAAEITYVSGAVGNAVEDFKKIVAPWEAKQATLLNWFQCLHPQPTNSVSTVYGWRLATATSTCTKQT